MATISQVLALHLRGQVKHAIGMTFYSLLSEACRLKRLAIIIEINYSEKYLKDAIEE